MDTLTYFIIAGVVFVILEVTGILLAKQFLDGDIETGQVGVTTLCLLMASAMWFMTVPLGILAGLLWLFSRLISEWLNK